MEEFLEKQREKLKTLKKEIEEQLLSFAKKDKKIKENWKSNFPEFDGSETGGSRLEVAQDEVEEYLNRLPLEYLLELKLRDINLALKKIKKGEYGICEKCKKKIPKSRLKIQPEARFCLKCLKK
ncbi:MAG: TraR/DksA C4-type zinc finger protein [Candidatus Pacebacteria bacterium]|nr:TraR/DksA C4-type zinc finger protein [Candidatus Paceibacterota bacterium]